MNSPLGPQPALGRALHELYGALTLLYHEAEGLQQPSSPDPLFAFLHEIDSHLVGRTFLARYGTSALSTSPEDTLVSLTAALQSYRLALSAKRK